MKKIHFIFLCGFIGSGLAHAGVQTTANQDKPPRLYIQSYIESRSATIQGTDNSVWGEVDPTYGGRDYEDWNSLWSITENTSYHDGSAGSASCQMQAAWNETIFGPGPDGGYYSYASSEYADAYSISSRLGIDPATVSATMTDISSSQFYSWATDLPTNNSAYGPTTQVWTNLGFPVMSEHCDVGAPIRDRSRTGIEPYLGDGTETYDLPETYRRTAQTVWHLQTGGKATFGGRNLFALSASAIHYAPVRVDDGGARAYPWLYLPFDDPYNSNGEFDQFYPDIEPPGSVVPPPNIVIGGYGGQKLQLVAVGSGYYYTNWVLYVPLKNNDDVDVTPYAAGLDNYTSSISVTWPKTKADWQKVVRYEIDNDSGVQIENYLAANGFMTNRANIQSVYAFYQKVFTEEPTWYYWCGLAKLAGAPVYAGLSDAEYVRAGAIVSGYLDIVDGSAIAADLLAAKAGQFQTDLIQMNIDIYSDIDWQFEAYRKSGLGALEEIAATPGNEDAIDIQAWRFIDEGIQDDDDIEIQEGNTLIAQQEQNIILVQGYQNLSNLFPGTTSLMSILAQNPVVGGPSFSTLEPGGDIANTDTRWNWVSRSYTNPSNTGIFPLWLQESSSSRLGDVGQSLLYRAQNDFSLAYEYFGLTIY